MSPRENNDIRWGSLHRIRPDVKDPGKADGNRARRQVDRQAKKAKASKSERDAALKQAGLWGKTEAEKKKDKKPKKKGGLW